MNATIQNTKTFGATVIRVFLIFIFLMLATDSLTRLYYTYMPISTWIDFRGLEVKQNGDEATVFIERYPKEDRMVVVRRVLSVLAPSRGRACGTTIQGVINVAESGIAQVPLSSVLSDDCSERLRGTNVDARLQISYVFEFPFGIQRLVTQWSNPFLLEQQDGRFRVSPVPPGKQASIEP